MTNKPLSVLILAVSFVLVNCEVVDDLSCANQVLRECPCSFGKLALGKVKVDKNLCDKLQACANCMSVPRCIHVNFLSRFIFLLLTTLKIARIKNECPGIRYQKLQKLMKGRLKGCHPGKKVFFYDECGHRCECDRKGYILSCKRIRKEFTQMSFDERRRFVDAYYKASTNPHYKTEFTKLLDLHSEIPSDFLHHMPNIFFPWHRWYLLKIENYLRRIDCRVTAPYYQWTARVDDKTVWRTSDPTDVWHGGPAGLGGNGVKPSLCVQTGKFREGNWWIQTSEGNACLKRNFDFKCRLYNQKRTDNLLKSSFKDFEEVIREEHHPAFHDCIGGNMPNNLISAYAPEFVLHHSFMDKLWDSFQQRGYMYKYAYYPSINFKMPFADVRGSRFLDNDNLPGNVAVGYEDMKTRKSVKREKNSIYTDLFLTDESINDQDLSQRDESVLESLDLSGKDETALDSEEDVLEPDLPQTVLGPDL